MKILYNPTPSKYQPQPDGAVYSLELDNNSSMSVADLCKMAGGWLTDCVLPSAYFNFSLVVQLKSCHPHDRQIEAGQEEVDDDEQTDVEEDGENAGSIFEGFSEWLRTGLGSLSKDSDKVTDRQDGWLFQRSVGDDCTDLINTSVGVSASVVTLLQICLALLAVAVVFPWFLKIMTPFLRKIRTRHLQEDAVPNQLCETDATGDMKVEAKIESVHDDSQTQMKEIHKLNNQPSKSQMPVVIPLHGCGSLKACTDILGKPDASQFLTNTVDHFLYELDRVLGLTALETSPSTESLPAFAASSTPRLERKGSVRRPRWRSPHSLPLGAASMCPDDKAAVRMWQRVEEMARRMRWTEVCVGDLDINAVQDNRLSAVLQFYQQACPVRTEQWCGACLIVDYVLSLLEQELIAGARQSDPLKILELNSFGSAANRTSISRMDRFDVMMVLQLPSCREMSVFHWGVCNEIPAGRLVLGVKEHTVTGASSSQQLLMKDRIGDSFGLFLSQKEVIKMTQKMIANALERLRTKNKGSFERLPFTIRLSPYDDLLLRIDTKLLNGMGLGVPEISIRLTPSLRVSSADCEPLPVLYAVPPWGSTSSDDSNSSGSRLHSRILRNRSHGVPPDLLWQLNCTALTKSFMATADSKLTTAGVWGCQVMCQQILRALFSRSGKDTLLTSGEVHPHILDTIVCFLLLESPPAAWDLLSLPDRLSDCVLFLRSAVQSAWMPDFTLHNPHLLKQMPALKLLPLLNLGRQENLLSNVGPDAADTIQAFMDTRLQETGLRRCLKSEYSSEMWEYEFFIFG
ncbi:hypothetical protein BaRGS_00016227 [Batillaria attramentaria]|uniref:Mab-21-like HhH/H2TH-like domain-containing protein n=1 Tax=Batillaria attramentaria TaxID=370345 RepID=A0ABD0KZW5_9CAEN